MAAAKAVGATPVATEATVMMLTVGGVTMLMGWVDVNQVGSGSE
jgi:hypothetical protein